MTSPKRYLTHMTLFIGIIAVAAGLLIAPLRDAFTANMPLNGAILLVLLFGIWWIFGLVTSLKPEIRWVEAFRADGAEEGEESEEPATEQDIDAPGTLTADRPAPPPETKPETEKEKPKAVQPRLLAAVAALLEAEDASSKLTSMSLRSLLDSIAARLEEGRDISRYLIGLLIFLGLLGTFWGLLGTIGAIGDTIRSLSATSGDYAVMFDDLKAGLQAPLSGMGTAFSSSLFGLAGSVVLGFLDLQAGQAQNRFYNDLEEWLSGQTRLTRAGLGDEGISGGAYLTALMEQSSDSIDALRRSLKAADDGRRDSDAVIMRLSEQLASLADQMKIDREAQAQLATAIAGLGEAVAASAAPPSTAAADQGFDEASRDHLRNMDVHLKRLADAEARGREDLRDDLRAEFKLLSRTIAALASQGRGQGGDS